MSCRRKAGFTLFEVVIVLGIVAGLFSMAVLAIGGNTKRELKAEANALVRVIRHAYFEAAQSGQTFRLLFDFEEQTYVVESVDRHIRVVRDDDAIEIARREREKNNHDAEKESPAPPPAFTEVDADIVELHKFPESVKLSSIRVAHLKNPVTEGKVGLHFFASGQTQFAVLHLVNREDEDMALTLIVNPLNGTVEMREGTIEAEDILAEMDADD